MHRDKTMSGSREGNGVVPMNQGRPRAGRDTAVGTLGDGPYAFVSTASLTHITAQASAETASAVVVMEGSMIPAGPWSLLATSGTIPIDGTVLLEYEGAIPFVRFVASSAAGSMVTVGMYAK